MKTLRRLKRFAIFSVPYAVLRTLRDQYGLGLSWVIGIWRLILFIYEYRKYAVINQMSPFTLEARDLLPCLTNRTTTTPIEPIYFLQDTWFARLIAKQSPSAHVDVGSSVKSMALIAQFVSLTFIDIRPIDIEVGNLSYTRGSILNMPYKDGSVYSLSSLCVIEHIGLGRYGDPFDAHGSEKAAHELCRILAPSGNLYISVPVDSKCRVYYNAHRAFTREYLLSLFSALTLVEEQYIYGRGIFNMYDPQRGFGTGLYHFRRL